MNNWRILGNYYSFLLVFRAISFCLAVSETAGRIDCVVLLETEDPRILSAIFPTQNYRGNFYSHVLWPFTINLPFYAFKGPDMANDIRVQHMLWSFLLTVRLIIVYSC